MPDGEATGAGDLAAGRLEIAGDAAQQGGFAAPVGGDEADAVAAGDGQVEIGEEGAASVTPSARILMSDMKNLWSSRPRGAASAVDHAKRHKESGCGETASPDRRTRREVCSFRSALQTHLQGKIGTMRAVWQKFVFHAQSSLTCCERRIDTTGGWAWQPGEGRTAQIFSARKSIKARMRAARCSWPT